MKYLLCKQALTNCLTTGKTYSVVSEDNNWWSILDDDGLRYYILKASCPNWEEQQK